MGLTMDGLNHFYDNHVSKTLYEACLIKNNLSCIFDVEPENMVSTADKCMWEDLKNEFTKIPYRPNCDQDIIDKVHEFYRNKTKEELTLTSEGFCKDYVNKKGDKKPFDEI